MAGVALVALAVSLVLLATTGWVLDPLLGPVLSRVVDQQAAARPELRHLRIRLHPTQGLRVVAGGFRLTRADGRELAGVERVRVEWPIRRLRQRHWFPAEVEIGPVELKLWKGANGAWEWLPAQPAAPEEAGSEAAPLDWTNIEGMVARALPLEGEPGEVRWGPVTVRLMDAPELPVFALEQGNLLVRRDGRTLGIESVGSARIDAHGAQFGLRTRMDFATLTVAGDWSGERIDLGWIGGVARASGLDATVEGRVDVRFEWEAGLEPLSPMRIAYEVTSAGLQVALPGMLREPLRVEPWQTRAQFDFRTGMGAMEPLTVQAGPVRIQARMETRTDPKTGEQFLNFGAGLQAFTLADVVDLLDPQIAAPLEHWMEQTGGWQLQRFGIDGWLALDLSNPNQPLPARAHWTFDTSLLAGEQELALRAEANWTANPFVCEIDWEIPAFNPASVPLPANLQQLLALADLPIGASGQAVFDAPTNLSRARALVNLGAGSLGAPDPLRAMLARPVRFDGGQLELRVANNTRTLRLERMSLGWEGMRLDSNGFDVTLDHPVVALVTGTALQWALDGDLSLTGMRLDRLAGPLSPDLVALIPIPSASHSECAVGALHLSTRLAGGVSPELAPAVSTAVLDLEIANVSAAVPEFGAVSIAGIEMEAGLESGRLTIGPVKTELYGGELSLNADWSGVPLALPAQITVALSATPGMVTHTALWPKPWPVEAIALSAVVRPAERAISDVRARFTGAGVAVALEDLSAHPDGARWAVSARAAIERIDLARVLELWPVGIAEELRTGVTEMDPRGVIGPGKLRVGALLDPQTPSPDDLHELEFELQTSDWQAAYRDWVKAQIPALTLAGNRDRVSITIPSSSVGPLRMESCAIGIDQPLSNAPGVNALWNARLDLAALSTLIKNASDPALRDAASAALAGISGTVDISGTVAGPAIMPLAVADWSGSLKLSTRGLRMPIPVEDLTLIAPALSLDASLAAGVIEATMNANVADVRYMDWVRGPVTARVDLAGADMTGAQLRWSVNADGMTIAPPAVPSLKPAGAPAHCSGTLGVSALQQDGWAVDAGIDGHLLLPFSAQTRALIQPDEGAPLGGLRELQIASAALGRSDIQGALRMGQNQRIELNLRGNALFVEELLGAIEPLIDDYLVAARESEDADAGTAQETTPAPADADGPQAAQQDPAADPPATPLDARIAFARIQLSPGRVLRDFTTTVHTTDAALPDLELGAVEGDGHRVRIALQAQPEGGHHLAVNIPDVAGLATLCVAPLADLDLPKSGLVANLDVVRRVPDSFAGGTLILDGVVFPPMPETVFDGTLRIDDMLMVKAPCLLRAVAAVSGKRFVEGVAFKLFEMERFSVGPKSFSVTNLRLDGPVTMNVFEGLYRFEDQYIKVSGDHYFTNFVLEGPITSPEVWLDNRMTRALGTDDSDWTDW